MQRLVTVLICLAFANSAGADVPPPSGYKRVSVSNIVETEKSFSDYRFYRVVCDRGGPIYVKKTPSGIWPRLAAQVEIVPGRPLTIHVNSRKSDVELIAVPASTEIDHIPLNDLWEAVKQGKVPGAFIAKPQFGYQHDIPTSDSRNAVNLRWRLERITAEEGIVLEPIDKDPEPFVLQPKDVAIWIALLLAAVTIFRFGLWLYRRRQRNLQRLPDCRPSSAARIL